MPDVGRALAALRRDVPPPRPRLLATAIVSRLLPDYAFLSVRSQLLRWCGWQVGAGAVLFGGPRWYGHGPIQQRLSVGADVRINIGCRIELADQVVIGDRAALGHEVLVLTSSHRLGRSDRRAGPSETAPVTIGAGAWLGARCVILPGVTVGHGAVVTAGSVVNKNVPPNTVFGGVPGAVIVPRLPS